MPPLTDLSAIRGLLETDRPWSVYALGDLEPARFAHCSWFGALGPAPALALLYRGFSPPVLLTLGRPEALRPLCAEIAGTAEMYLHVRPEAVPLLEETYRIVQRQEMLRMILDRAAFRPQRPQGLTPLGVGHLEALRRLYADGAASRQSPAFFTASMLAEGVYFGASEGGELMAAAGTHLVAVTEGVAAVGNVYTRQDRRGRGLASRLVAAVVAELLDRRVRTVALNVTRDNATAQRIYEKIGFLPYCDFVEGLAIRAPATAGDAGPPPPPAQ